MLFRWPQLPDRPRTNPPDRRLHRPFRLPRFSGLPLIAVLLSALLSLAALLPLGGLGARAAGIGSPSQPLAESSETLASRSPWSRPESYPLALKPRTDLYRPSAEWIGRLILPTAQEIAAAEAPPEDWAWIEL